MKHNSIIISMPGHNHLSITRKELLLNWKKYRKIKSCCHQLLLKIILLTLIQWTDSILMNILNRELEKYWYRARLILNK